MNILDNIGQAQMNAVNEQREIPESAQRYPENQRESR